MQDIKETLNSLLSELLSEMEKNKFKGDYKINSETIEWKIQDDVKIIIYPGASDAGNDDVIDFYYKDPNGDEYMYDGSDDEYEQWLTDIKDKIAETNMARNGQLRSDFSGIKIYR